MGRGTGPLQRKILHRCWAAFEDQSASGWVSVDDIAPADEYDADQRKRVRRSMMQLRDRGLVKFRDGRPAKVRLIDG